MQSCEKIGSLEELQDLGEEVQILIGTLDYELETYVKSQIIMDEILNNIDKVTECINEKTKEFS